MTARNITFTDFPAYLIRYRPEWTTREIADAWKWYEEAVTVQGLPNYDGLNLKKSIVTVDFVANATRKTRAKILQFFSYLESAVSDGVLPADAITLKRTTAEQAQEDKREADAAAIENNITWMPDVIEGPLKRAAKITVWVVLGVAALAAFAAYRKGKKVFA